MKPEITGVVPCHNAQDTLESVILSLKLQSIPLYEIIVIDDGSTDSSCSIASDLGCRLIPINKSKGRGHARMVGVSESKTPFILFCDSSNTLPSYFAEQAIQKFKDPLVCATFGRILNHQNLKGCLTHWRSSPFVENKISTNKIHQVNCLITYGVLLRKEHVLKVGNFNPCFKTV